MKKLIIHDRTQTVTDYTGFGTAEYAVNQVYKYICDAQGIISQ